jgi:hypothetical protein
MNLAKLRALDDLLEKYKFTTVSWCSTLLGTSVHEKYQKKLDKVKNDILIFFKENSNESK